MSGYPQLSAVVECADAAHALGGKVISDGGCTNPGDMAKAFGAGADYVMAGGMFAGHSESGGQLVTINGKQFKEFYGMSSATAMKKYVGKVANYRASEGKTIRVPYRGNVEFTVLDMLGGIRSACTYVGNIVSIFPLFHLLDGLFLRICNPRSTIFQNNFHSSANANQ